MTNVAQMKLLERVRDPGFLPTPAFEKGLAEKFFKKLNIVLSQSELAANSDMIRLDLEELVCCISTVAEKDTQFIFLLYSGNDVQVDLLVTVLKQEDDQILPIVTQSKVLEVVHQIVMFVPHAADSFAYHGVVAALISRIHKLDILMFGVGDIINCLDVLEKTTDTRKTLQELSTVYSLQGFFCVLEFLLNTTASTHQGFDEAVEKCLGLISKITNNGPLNNAYHLRKTNFVNILTKLEKTLPQFKEALTALQFQLQESLHESLVGGSSRAFTAPKTGAKGSPQREQSLARKLAINQLICSARNDGIAATMTHPVIEPASLLRYSFVQKLDPDLNAFFSEKNVGQFSLDITAEVICGMLNSNKGGSIHFGLSSTGRIEGVRISHEERDGFRSGLDQLFLNKISPLLPPSLVNLKFVPVTSTDGEENSQRPLYVIRLVIPGNMNTPYYLKEANACFLRRGNGHFQLNLRDVRRMSASLIEKRFSSALAF